MLLNIHSEFYANSNLVADKMLIKALWLVTFVCTLCIPAYPIAIQRNSRIIRRTGPIHPVLGVRGLGIDTIHPRIEIRKLERNKDQFNVYLLGLRRLQSIGQYDKFSYYQIAGKLCNFVLQHRTRSCY